MWLPRKPSGKEFEMVKLIFNATQEVTSEEKQPAPDEAPSRLPVVSTPIEIFPVGAEVVVIESPTVCHAAIVVKQNGKDHEVLPFNQFRLFLTCCEGGSSGTRTGR